MTKGFFKILFTTGLVILQIAAVHTVQAGEHRQHEAHEHGVAHLNVVLEGSNLAIELSSPAANVVGFEHPPRTQAQRDQVKEARKKLEAAETLFLVPAKVQARLVKSSVDTNIDSDSAAASEAEHTHGPSEVDHDDEHDHEQHSDFKAKYHFICTKPDKLAYLDVMLFQVFPGIERIEVQILTDTGQTARELTAKDYQITF